MNTASCRAGPKLTGALFPHPIPDPCFHRGHNADTAVNQAGVVIGKSEAERDQREAVRQSGKASNLYSYREVLPLDYGRRDEVGIVMDKCDVLSLAQSQEERLKSPVYGGFETCVRALATRFNQHDLHI